MSKSKLIATVVVLALPNLSAADDRVIFGADGSKADARAHVTSARDKVPTEVVRLRSLALEPYGPENDPALAETDESMDSTGGAPEAVNDVLWISRDDTVRPKVWPSTTANREHEGSIEAPAGPRARIAFRFETNAFVHEYPIQVRGADVTLDNGFGRHMWPVGFYGENPLSPMVPDLAARLADGGTVNGTTLTVPAVPGVPDDWLRFGVDLVASGQTFSIAKNFIIDDGTMSDNFDRPNEALDNPTSDWLECAEASCGANGFLQIIGNLVVKRDPLNPTSALPPVRGVKVNANATQFALRPVFATNYAVEADYDVSAAGAEQAGLMTRFEFLDGFYYAAYNKSTTSVVLRRVNGDAMPPTAPTVTDLAPPVIVAAANAGKLRLEVHGAAPQVTLTVYLNGNPIIGPVTETTQRWNSAAVGIVSDVTSSGETWNNFKLFRDPDLFIVLDSPAVGAKLPADLSRGTVSWDSVLVTADSASWALRPVDAGCKAANGFVWLRIADNTNDGLDNLFNRELNTHNLRLTCPGCSTRPSTCTAMQGASQQRLPIFEALQPIEVLARIRIDHAQDFPPAPGMCPYPPDPTGLPAVWFQVFEEPGVGSAPESVLRRQCVRSGPRVHSDAQIFGLATGQNTTLAPSDVARCIGCPPGTDEGSWTTFTPTTLGWHCMELCEVYDTNGDCSIPDRPSPDHRPYTRCVAQFFQVEDGTCVDAADNYNKNSLWLLKSSASCAAGQTYGTWTRTMPLTTDTYNLHEHTTRASYVADRMTNPYPLPAANPPLLTAAPPPNFCFNSAATASGSISYYTMWQANCDQSSRRDP